MSTYHGQGVTLYRYRYISSLLTFCVYMYVCPIVHVPLSSCPPLFYGGGGSWGKFMYFYSGTSIIRTLSTANNLSGLLQHSDKWITDVKVFLILKIGSHQNFQVGKSSVWLASGKYIYMLRGMIMHIIEIALLRHPS